MKYKELSVQVKPLVNRSLFSKFSYGYLDFKGEDEVFATWFRIQFYRNEIGEGYHFCLGQRQI